MNQKNTGKTEQEIEVTTYVKFDKVDALKLLFGRCLKLDHRIIVLQEEPVTHFNTGTKMSVVPSTGMFTTQDKPPFGYMALAETEHKEQGQ